MSWVLSLSHIYFFLVLSHEPELIVSEILGQKTNKNKNRNKQKKKNRKKKQHSCDRKLMCFLLYFYLECVPPCLSHWLGHGWDSTSIPFLMLGIPFVEELHGLHIDWREIRPISLPRRSMLSWKNTQYSDVFRKGPLQGAPSGNLIF